MTSGTDHSRQINIACWKSALSSRMIADASHIIGDEDRDRNISLGVSLLVGVAYLIPVFNRCRRLARKRGHTGPADMGREGPAHHLLGCEYEHIACTNVAHHHAGKHDKTIWDGRTGRD